jgi:hypothetical protein
MCLIIHKPADCKFDINIVNNAAMMHSDGFGIMWLEDGKVQSYKSADMSGLETVVSSINECDMAGIGVGLHLRYATHGSVRDGNCHPFVNKGKRFGLMHNGVIRTAKTVGDETDSNAFCREVAFPALRKHEITRAASLIEESHGTGNRTLIFSSKGEFVRTGSWVERDGLHYSNGTGFYAGYNTKWISSEPDYKTPYFIEDFSGWSLSQIKAYIKKYPDLAADMIYDHLMASEYENRSYNS